MRLAEKARSRWCDSAPTAAKTATPANARPIAYGVGEGEAALGGEREHPGRLPR